MIIKNTFACLYHFTTSFIATSLRVSPSRMQPRKLDWGDMPHINEVKEKDVLGIRAPFISTEWVYICASSKHQQKLNYTILNNITKVGDTISKLLKLIEEGCKDPLNIAFMCPYVLELFTYFFSAFDC